MVDGKINPLSAGCCFSKSRTTEGKTIVLREAFVFGSVMTARPLISLTVFSIVMVPLGQLIFCHSNPRISPRLAPVVSAMR